MEQAGNQAGPEQPAAVINEVQCPKLARMLGIIAKAVLQEYAQPGGPSANPTMEFSVDCSDDPVLRQVLEMKGGQLGIVIKLRAPAPVDQVDPGHAERMAKLRAECGVGPQFTGFGS
jgi:hypothetical protein